MPAHILGIDAAWTAHQPSGVALLRVRKNAKPELIALGRSYDEFLGSEAHAEIDWRTRVRGCLPPIDALLTRCKKLTGELPQIVALDIPLAAKPLNGRRPCDNAVTSAYVSRGAGTHTPSALRPGPISKSLFQQLCKAGYEWYTHGAAKRAARVFIETYPHPAIIELMQLRMRLAYKTSRLSQYWSEAKSRTRWLRLCKNLDALRRALADEIDGLENLIPSAKILLKNGNKARLKHLEDALDAVVCAWIGYQFWRGRARPYGNQEAAIWLPAPDFRSKKLVMASKI
ncbi:DUF429 domain-containing protein [candidate division KSB1 bacterium]|nr:MAG: DUF429 domain-containing protein [candidate division KSB1 bacterium]MBC6950390.1 DUF429 domain-containing protein [candidate division KSB1 bacterium]MCE7942984.1 DUF429 domain-containing protein [Chlorobi bacterium CHB1]MDL1878870.1 DUF429 domain-containing protein [Cytophagia bacterium CHB2]